MRYRELEQCKDFDKLKVVFDDGMLGYLEKQLRNYLNGSEDRPPVTVWWEGGISTNEFIRMCSLN